MAQRITALSDAALRSLKPTGERYEVIDKVMQGLVGRVSASGRVMFVLRARNAAGKMQTVTLGAYPDLTLKSARDAANRTKLEMKSGRDINGEKKLVRETTLMEQDKTTLRAVVLEYEQRFSASKSSWRARGPKTERSGARQVIERVYADLLDKPITKLSDEDFAASISNYRRLRPSDGRTTANGQASRARAYLSPVLDWVAGRKSFQKLGASRTQRLPVASLMTTHDPASDDPTITGKRTRVLTEAELKAVLPFLVYPAPELETLRLGRHLDFRPIAMRFMLLTAARLDEVCSMRWQDIDRTNSVWRKPAVKSTRGGPRGQALPLPEPVMALLRELPGWKAAKPDQLVFPNGAGTGPLDNWTRFQKALHIASGTTDWHRHDLRRTAATIMHSLKVPASTIEQILAHTDPLRGDNVGASASHYIQLGRVLKNARDPQEEALSTLAEALAYIETTDTREG
ncbi:tyrosine-type recombinase/integrase [Paragemmobacter straminiformis]|uniref:Integrase family protein n=1 Tax=Paragemmobacter straminiformis TaxID=2045119 RepID=A0A842I2U7_9RHOB|nr:tyrosine-type recombinase/integrase [Gemmobacter straminiformis]MBC2834059.1 integrase family protein [Gemmobacter straminiformis]